jgi:hypothetical protein
MPEIPNTSHQPVRARDNQGRFTITGPTYSLTEQFGDAEAERLFITLQVAAKQRIVAREAAKIARQASREAELVQQAAHDAYTRALDELDDLLQDELPIYHEPSELRSPSIYSSLAHLDL